MKKHTTLQTCSSCGFRVREPWPPHKPPLCLSCSSLAFTSPLAPGHVFVWLPETTQPFAAALARTALCIRHLGLQSPEPGTSRAAPPAPVSKKVREPDSEGEIDFNFGFGTKEQPWRHVFDGAGAVLGTLRERGNHLRSSLGLRPDEDIHKAIESLTHEQAFIVKKGLRAVPLDADDCTIGIWLEHGGTFSGFTLESAAKAGDSHD